MRVIHNGVEKDIDLQKENLILNKWKYKFVTGDEKIEKPGLCLFNNSIEACKLLYKHVKNNSLIALHTDVDLDGLGSTYILDRALLSLGCKNKQYIINKDKVHGIQQKHADAYNSMDESKRPQLLIISDSSTNELEIIKDFNFDVLVIDHHDILIKNEELSGRNKANTHDYVIVNNTIDNLKFDSDIFQLENEFRCNTDNIEKYIEEPRMSCGLVIYELLRVFSLMYNIGEQWLEDLVLYQWAGVTLFTDAIPLLNARNQYYMSRTLNSNVTEVSLKIMQENINKYKKSLDKTYIDYSFAPVINKAIRAGKSLDALQIILKYPNKVSELNIYKEAQDYAINSVIYSNYRELRDLVTNTMKVLNCSQEDAIKDLKSRNIVLDNIIRTFDTNYIIEDITSKGINANYTGVIAGRLCGMHNKNSVCFHVDSDGYAKGSFRGRNAEVKYRSTFMNILNQFDTEENNEKNNVFAEGHEPAFGFRCKATDLEFIMQRLNELDEHTNTREYISVGDMPENEYGVYHILDFDAFKMNGDLYRIAIGNSRLQGSDVIYIKIPASDAKLLSSNEKKTLFMYNVYGLECKAFKQLTGKYYKIYLEFSNEINCFLRDNIS